MDGKLFGFFILINVFLALFNMLPIPPFDGSHIVGGCPALGELAKAAAMGMLLFLCLAALTFPAGWVERIFPPVNGWSTVLWLEAVSNG